MHLHPDIAPDLQLDPPRVALALDGAGVQGVRRSLIGPDGVRAMATIDATVDLESTRRGVHMSRFHEGIAEAIDATLAAAVREAPGPHELAERIATRVAERQESSRAAVAIAYDIELREQTPATGRATVQSAQLRGDAVADGTRGTARRVLSVTVVGMNACPCAQELVRATARRNLRAVGFDDAQVELALDAIPVATHNQRGTATLAIGTAGTVDPLQLADLARDAMSARVYELLKRDDELSVVEAAHARPRFVEDCVREVLAGVLAAGLELADGDLAWARQVNHESIHAHDVVAERGATIAALRAELAGGDAAAALTPTAWLTGS